MYVVIFVLVYCFGVLEKLLVGIFVFGWLDVEFFDIVGYFIIMGV